MSRSSGFKINRHLHNFIRILKSNDPNTPDVVPEGQAIFELRSICGKYQPMTAIEADLVEIAALETTQEATETDEAA